MDRTVPFSLLWSRLRIRHDEEDPLLETFEVEASVRYLLQRLYALVKAFRGPVGEPPSRLRPRESVRDFDPSMAVGQTAIGRKMAAPPLANGIAGAGPTTAAWFGT